MERSQGVRISPCSSERIFLQYLHRLKVAHQKAQGPSGVLPDVLRNALGQPTPYEAAIMELRKTMRQMELTSGWTTRVMTPTLSGSTQSSLMTDSTSITTTRSTSATPMPMTSMSVSTTTSAVVVKGERTRHSTRPECNLHPQVESLTRIYDPENEFRDVIERDIALWDTSIGNEAEEREAALRDAQSQRQELDVYI